MAAMLAAEICKLWLCSELLAAMEDSGTGLTSALINAGVINKHSKLANIAETTGILIVV